MGYELFPYYNPEVIPAADALFERVDELRRVWRMRVEDRERIRAIMNGGRPAIKALFGEDTKFKDRDLPAANFLDSNLDRLAHKLGHAPNVKVVPPLGDDGPRQRYNADQLEEMVAGYDWRQRLELQLPQLARWLPGYGFSVFVAKQVRDPISGHWYPSAGIRNSFDCYPSEWDADEDPDELAVMRVVSAKKLAAAYPAFRARHKMEPVGAAGIVHTSQVGQWSNQAQDGVIIYEFYDRSGCYLLADETRQLLDFWPNPVDLPPFVVTRRFTFDQLQGQIQHVIGLQAMLAKLNILGYIAAEDAVFRETNIIGDMSQRTYKRGRLATNYFPQGTQVSKPQLDANLFQAWTQIDRLERQLRIGSNYPQTADAESPTSFATGQGIDRLTISFDENIAEYQKSFRWGLQKLDALRLAWDEALYSGTTKPMYSLVGGEVRHGKYDPSRIKGWYSTHRVYGMMASWDEPQKIVGGLQLLAADVIDVQEMQENLYGLNQVSRIQERNLKADTRTFMLESLAQRAQAGDPRAMLALVEIHNEPRDIDRILTTHFTPEEPQEGPGVEQFLSGLPGGAGPEPEPPDITTILSRLEAGGEVGTGAQTVARV